MSLVTGTPIGNVVSQEDIFIEGAPEIYFQSNNATPLFNPDAQSYYWGLSGTVANPVYNIGCPLDVSLTEGVTMNDVRCDTVGVKDTIQRRDYIDLVFTFSSMFPLSVLAKVLNLSTANVTTGIERVGIGAINNTLKYMVYCPRVYDESSGDYLLLHLHKAKFVDAWTINFQYAQPWQGTGIKLRAYADTTKPANQLFGVFLRSDLSALP